MRNFVSLCTLLLVFALAATSQDNRSVAVYGIGASGFASGGNNSQGLGTMYGGGFTVKPDSRFGFNFLGTFGSPVSDTTLNRLEGFPANQTPSFNHTTSTKTRLVAGLFQTALGPERSRAKFVLGAGPAFLMQSTTNTIQTVSNGPDWFRFDRDNYSYNSSFNQVALAVSAGVVVRAGSWGDVRFGVMYLRPMTNTNQVGSGAYFMPMGGVGAGQ